MASRPANEETSGVLAIRRLEGDERAVDLPQTGDIVVRIKIGAMTVELNSNYGESRVQEILRQSFQQNERSINIRVRRASEEFVDMEGSIVVKERFGRKNLYFVRAVSNTKHAIALVDRSRASYFSLSESRSLRIADATRVVQDGYHRYDWGIKKTEVQSLPNPTVFYSILFLPTAGAGDNDLEDTISRATTWLNATQSEGVPVVFTSMQTESLLIKISGETLPSSVNVGSLSRMSNVANMSLYGFEDFHGLDMGVARGVRLWFSPILPEVRIEIKLKKNESKLGFSMQRTDEGFIYISNVEDPVHAGNIPSARSGIYEMYRQAEKASQKLVISRISDQKILPWMVSPEGSIRCFDTVSLSNILSRHCRSKDPIIMHVLICDASSISLSRPPLSSHPSMNQSRRQPGEGEDHAGIYRSGRTDSMFSFESLTSSDLSQDRSDPNFSS